MGSAKRCCATGLEIMFRGMASGARSAASPRGYISRKFNVTCHTPCRHDSLAASTYCSLHLGTCRTTDRRPSPGDADMISTPWPSCSLPYPTHYVSSMSPCRYDVNKMYAPHAVSRTFGMTCHTPRHHDSLAV
ncbi:hypothetical protein Hypma_004129 [Hypsizygus marmoreus]|uniref:Uncharacterized protein n=1 Tax=Hypsizygus marmoreus TaxID=39966 RepID=A0A369J344_HYPMA|nr:hypothetical protein Hypma_004129 [Hypsizygus marmoreus]